MYFSVDFMAKVTESNGKAITNKKISGDLIMKKRLEWNVFYITNALVMVLGVTAAMVAYNCQTWPWAYPAHDDQ
jgi:hypothetical protein